MGEFDIIREIFAPLTSEADGAFALTDDAALVDAGEIVVSKDILVSGVHFRAKDPLDLVARKLLRVNLSDLAAKGAKPIGYFLGCVWPSAIKRDAIELFAKGLGEDQTQFRLALYGGDTTAHKTRSGPLTLSATIFGRPPKRGVIRRTTASVRDDLYVSGTIGDAGLGLRALEKDIAVTTVDRASLANRYHLPEPRLQLGSALAGLASAAIDVSDGLLADAGHLAKAAGLKAEIEAARIPLSAPAKSWVESEPSQLDAVATLASFGDDYEILFAAPSTLRRSVAVAADASRTPVTRVGMLTRGAGVALLDPDGAETTLGALGYDHFSA